MLRVLRGYEDLHCHTKMMCLSCQSVCQITSRKLTVCCHNCPSMNCQSSHLNAASVLKGLIYWGFMVGNGLLSVPEARIKHLNLCSSNQCLSVSFIFLFGRFLLLIFVHNFAEYSALLTRHTAKTFSKTLE